MPYHGDWMKGLFSVDLGFKEYRKLVQVILIKAEFYDYKHYFFGFGGIGLQVHFAYFDQYLV